MGLYEQLIITFGAFYTMIVSAGLVAVLIGLDQDKYDQNISAIKNNRFIDGGKELP
jgi:hypothetical protein